MVNFQNIYLNSPFYCILNICNNIRKGWSYEGSSTTKCTDVLKEILETNQDKTQNVRDYFAGFACSGALLTCFR